MCFSPPEQRLKRRVFYYYFLRKEGIMKVGVLCSIIRKEEKLLFSELKKRGVEFEKIDVREIILDYHEKMSHLIH